ncbi:MAG: tRNA (5-methylaminomethyl-2-thiouridine)(34)-methyltransferase MnmD [Maricaulaceae bacterium]
MTRQKKNTPHDKSRPVHPTQRPLAATPAPDMDWSRPQSPASEQFGDIYFSVDGGLAETRAVFLEACGLPERWDGLQNGTHFTIGELGFGTGLNFLASWQLWREGREVPHARSAAPHLHFVSIEKYPLSHEQLAQALASWPELSDLSGRLLALWPGRVPGIHRLHIAPDITLTLYHDDITEALPKMDMQADAWFLDGFSPAKNPDMWSKDVMRHLRNLSGPGARVGTFTVAGFVREALTEAGFEVQKKEGYGRKRHRLEARVMGAKPPPAVTSSPEKLSPIIIGAGIAGASLAHAFLRRGIVPTMIDANDNTAASRNEAALVTPRLDLQNQLPSRFHLAAYLYALRTYEAHGEIISKGVFQAAKSAEEGERFKLLAAQAALPQAHMKASRAGPYSSEGLSFPQALVINPKPTLENLYAGANHIYGKAASVERQSGNLHAVLNASGDVIAQGSHIIFALGAGIKTLDMFKNLHLRYRRGQLTHVDNTLEFVGGFTYGGYALPLKEGALLGATHTSIDMDDPYVASLADDVENLAAFEAASKLKLGSSPRSGRVSIRVNTPNTQPLIYHENERVMALTGLGSRGFMFAPLLAEAIVSQICKEPSPLAKGLFVQSAETHSAVTPPISRER